MLGIKPRPEFNFSYSFVCVQQSALSVHLVFRSAFLGDPSPESRKLQEPGAALETLRAVSGGLSNVSNVSAIMNLLSNVSNVSAI